MIGEERKESKDVVNLLGISIVNMIQEVDEECKIYSVNINLSRDKMKKIINETLEVDTEPILENERKDRSVIRLKNEEGLYLSVKNMRFSIVEFVGFLEIIYSGEWLPIIIAALLINLIKQLRIKIGRKDLVVYSILLSESKKRIITDENLRDVINPFLEKYGYEKLGVENLYLIIKQFLKWELISVIDGKYVANEKIYFC